jgi:ribosomal protein L22
MGSDNKGANPEGAAEAAGAQAVNPTAGGADLQDATQMIQGQKLQRAQDLLENVLMGR